MKTKLTAMLATFAMLAAAGAASGDVGIGASGTCWVPRDSDEDPYFGMGARVVAELVPVLGVEARVGAMQSRGDWTFRSAGGDWSDAECENDLLSVEAGLVATLPLGLFSLYGGGGAGAYFPDGELEAWHGGRHWRRIDLDCDSAVGTYAFAGLELHLAPCAALVGEFRYTWMETDVRAKWHGETLSEDAAVSFDGPGVAIGLLFWL